jgi:hypothetical protein
MKQMEIRLIEGQYKSSSARNWARPVALSVFGARDLTRIQSVFGNDMTRGAGKSTWDPLMTGNLQ